MSQLKLSDHFFIFYGASVALAILGLSFSVVSFFAFLLLVALILITIGDFFSLKKKLPRIEFHSLRNLGLDQEYEVQFYVTWDSDEKIPPQTWFLKPHSKLIEFADKHVNSKDLKLVKKSYRFPWKIRCKILGYSDEIEIIYQVRSRLGLWRKSFNIQCVSEGFRIHPLQHPVSDSRIREIIKKQSIFTWGSKKWMKGGNPDLFLQSRPFRYPDPLKHLDHKKTARFGQLMTKTFESQLNQNLVICFDCGRSAIGKIGSSSRFDYYLSAVHLLLQSALKFNDNVSFVSFSSRVHNMVRKARSLKEFDFLFNSSDGLRPQATESDYQILDEHISQLAPQRSIIFILSDLTKASVQRHAAKFVKRHSRKHLVVCASLIDTHYEPEDFILNLNSDSYEQESYSQLAYSYWLNLELQKFRYRINQSGAGMISVPQKEWMTLIHRSFHLVRESSRL